MARSVRSVVPVPVVQAIALELGVSPELVRAAGSVGGGSIHATQRLEVTGRGSFFVKWSSAERSDMLACEAAGLEALGAVQTVAVARPVAFAESPPFLLLDWIETGSKSRNTMAAFGRDFALMHRRSARRAVADRVPSSPLRFGFAHDNYIGASPQPNRFTDDWALFFRDQRLGHQLELLRQSGQLDDESERAFERLLARVDSLLAEPDEPPCVLHGDLWSGNYLVDEGSEAVLIDPAAYYGRREADLAMTRLFGGFDRRFYAAYQEVWPLEPGSEERLRIYELYHLMNHWNLFGSGYRGACLEIARRFG